VAQSNVNGTLRAAVSDVSEVVYAVERLKAGRTVALGAMRGASRMVGD